MDQTFFNRAFLAMAARGAGARKPGIECVFESVLDLHEAADTTGHASSGPLDIRYFRFGELKKRHIPVCDISRKRKVYGAFHTTTRKGIHAQHNTGRRLFAGRKNGTSHPTFSPTTKVQILHDALENLKTCGFQVR